MMPGKANNDIRMNLNTLANVEIQTMILRLARGEDYSPPIRTTRFVPDIDKGEHKTDSPSF